MTIQKGVAKGGSTSQYTKRNHYFTDKQLAFLNTKGSLKASKYLRDLLDQAIDKEGFVYEIK